MRRPAKKPKRFGERIALYLTEATYEAAAYAAALAEITTSEFMRQAIAHELARREEEQNAIRQLGARPRAGQGAKRGRGASAAKQLLKKA